MWLVWWINWVAGLIKDRPTVWMVDWLTGELLKIINWLAHFWMVDRWTDGYLTFVDAIAIFCYCSPNCQTEESEYITWGSTQLSVSCFHLCIAIPNFAEKNSLYLGCFRLPWLQTTITRQPTTLATKQGSTDYKNVIFCYSPTSFKRPPIKRLLSKVSIYLSVNCCIWYLYSTATSIKRPRPPFCCRKCIIYMVFYLH